MRTSQAVPREGSVTWSDNQALPTRATKVIFRRLPEGGVIYSTSSEIYFGLNDVGARIWELLPPASETFADMCNALEREFPDAPATLIRRDVTRYLDELIANALVLPVGASDGESSSGSAGA
ncbi:MAG: PqqD family protein [Vicinamibacterales bacterium]